MAVYYCCRHLALKLGWMASAYLKREGANPYIGECSHSLLYDRRLDWSLDVHDRTLNIGSLSYVMFCFVLTSPPLMLCVYLQTFEAALFWKKKKKGKRHL